MTENELIEFMKETESIKHEIRIRSINTMLKLQNIQASSIDKRLELLSCFVKNGLMSDTDRKMLVYKDCLFRTGENRYQSLAASDNQVFFLP